MKKRKLKISSLPKDDKTLLKKNSMTGHQNAKKHYPDTIPGYIISRNAYIHGYNDACDEAEKEAGRIGNKVALMINEYEEKLSSLQKERDQLKILVENLTKEITELGKVKADHLIVKPDHTISISFLDENGNHHNGMSGELFIELLRIAHPGEHSKITEIEIFIVHTAM